MYFTQIQQNAELEHFSPRKALTESFTIQDILWIYCRRLQNFPSSPWLKNPETFNDVGKNMAEENADDEMIDYDGKNENHDISNYRNENISQESIDQKD